jgi:hypothetical protein
VVSRKHSKEEDLGAHGAMGSVYQQHPSEHHQPRAPVHNAPPMQRTPAGAPSSFKVEEVVDLDDINEEPKVPEPKPETPPKAKEAPKEPKVEKPKSDDKPPKKDGSTDDILDEILGKAPK